MGQAELPVLNMLPMSQGLPVVNIYTIPMSQAWLIGIVYIFTTGSLA